MAVDIYCKIDGIDGESSDAKHDKWVELDSYTMEVSQPVSGESRTGGRSAGKADFKEFVIKKTVDKSTPDLHIYCASGKHIPKVEIECCLASEDKHVFMKYTLENVIISRINSGGSHDETRPAETVSFRYGKIKWEYTPIDHTGKPTAKVDRTWDIEKNQKA